MRELALDTLKRLTGRDDLGYDPDHPEGKGLNAWKELQRQGKLRFSAARARRNEVFGESKRPTSIGRSRSTCTHGRHELFGAWRSRIDCVIVDQSTNETRWEASSSSDDPEDCHPRRASRGGRSGQVVQLQKVPRLGFLHLSDHRHGLFAVGPSDRPPAQADSPARSDAGFRGAARVTAPSTDRSLSLVHHPEQSRKTSTRSGRGSSVPIFVVIKADQLATKRSSRRDRAAIATEARLGWSNPSRSAVESPRISPTSTLNSRSSSREPDPVWVPIRLDDQELDQSAAKVR